MMNDPRHLRAIAAVAALWLSGCGAQCAPTCVAEIDVVGPPNTTVGTPAGDARGSEGACMGPARDGTTTCFPGECSVGQHCDDTAMPTCRPGCVSDENCGARDICVRVGAAVIGRCEPCAGHPAHDAAPGCVVPSRTGTTACFPGECPVGERCVDEGMPHCEPGCLTDENCGPSESCTRDAGALLGVCRSCFY